jgi:hypothetical protein
LPDGKEIHIGIPVDGSYKLRVIGTDTGPLNLDFVGYDADGNPSLMSIAGNATAGSAIDYTVAYSSSQGSQIKVTPTLAPTPTPTPTATADPDSNADCMPNSGFQAPSQAS